MMDLLYLARDNDLPPKWDGHHVEWRGWEDMPHVFMCGRGAKAVQREVCAVCGSTEPTVRNVGIYRARDRRDGIEYGRRITALRCPNCMHDQVQDFHGVWWDLDPSDYGDDGSSVVQ